MWGHFRTAERLSASQEGRSSIDLVMHLQNEFNLRDFLLFYI
jgi:hypothetical protein